MDKLEFYIDDTGSPCARGRDHRVATYLQTDIQGSAEIAKHLISALDDTQYRGDITGNGHNVSVSKQMVTIESLFDDEMPARRLPRKDLLQIVRRWLKFIH